jgi:hypothetical protein
MMAADKGVFYTIGPGDTQIQVPNGQKTMEVVLQDMLHAPDMGLMVVLVGHIANAGHAIALEGNNCKIKNRKDIIGNIPTGPNGLYKVEHAYMAAEECEQLDNTRSSFIYLSCEYAKMTRKVIKKEYATGIADAFGTKIHTDIWGPSTIQTIAGHKYYVSFMDDDT